MQIKIISVLILSVLCSISHGDLGQKIDKLNSTVKRVGDPPQVCSTCDATSAGNGYYGDKGALMKSCVETICSKKEFSLAYTLDKIYDRVAKSNQVYDKEIQPLINAISKEDAKSKVTRARSYSEWLKNPPDLKKSGGILVFNFFTMYNSLSKFKFTASNGKLVIDIAASRSTFPQLSDEEFNRQVQIGGKILDAVLESAIVDTDPARVQLIYGSDFNARIDWVIDSFSYKQKQIEADPELNFVTKLPVFREMASGEELKQQFSEPNRINPDAITNLNTTNSILNLFVAISKDPEFKKMLDSPPIDMKKVIAQLGTEKLLKDREAQQQPILTGTVPALSAKCRIAFEMAQQVLPSERELDLFKAKVNGLKDRFFDKTKSLMCDSASKDYQSQVSLLSPKFPLTKEKHFENMKSSLSRRLTEAKKWKQKFEEMDRSPDKDIIYAIGVAGLKPDKGITSSSDDICDNLMTNIVPDATSYFSHSFVIGPMTIKHKDAAGICYHELGHSLFSFMKNQNACVDKSQFAKTRACLLSLHTELSPEEVAEQAKISLMGGNTKYESEDWADLISAHVDDRTSNFACLFAQKLNNEDYAQLSLKNADRSAPHSSALFRLLHLNFLKTGKTPVQCEQALSARGEKANFKNCLQVQ